MEWTKELRYLNYSEWDQNHLLNLKEDKENSPWNNHFHIEPESGLLNDPNGFSYFNGKWHLFYQHFPFGPIHGLKSWKHLTSTDLVNWTLDDTELFADTKFDSHGAYSGSAYPVDDQLFIFYTGNHRDENWERHAFQVGAYMDKEGHISKFEESLIDHEEGYTSHFRDPMIFTYDGNYYAVIGAQKENLKGCVVLYKAINNDLKDWKKVDDLKFTDQDLGYMVECPNLVFVNGKVILLLCPQGMDDIDNENIYPQAYVIADKFNPQDASLTDPSEVRNLDYGFDVYASQAINALDGRALSISWLGLPEIEYPTDQLGHQGALSLVKELSVIDGKLYQYPVREMKNLRKNEVETKSHIFEENKYEAEIIINPQENVEISFYANQESGKELKLEVLDGQIILDRSLSGQEFALDFGQVRTFSFDASKELKINAFVDTSVIEIFFNDGEFVSSSRIFPGDKQKEFYVKGDTKKVVLYEF